MSAEAAGIADGNWSASWRTEGEALFQEARAPTGDELEGLLDELTARVMKMLTRLGYRVEEHGMTYLADTRMRIIRWRHCKRPRGLAGRAGPGARPLARHKQSTGPLVSGLGLLHRLGSARRTEGAELAYRGQPGEKNAAVLCAEAHGFSLHAAVHVASDQRKELERLCRYITRLAIANERLSRNSKGQVVLQLKRPYRDGTTQIVMSAQEFMQRLAVLVPRPRLRRIRFQGVLAPHAKLRAAIIPQPAQKQSAPMHEHAHGKAARLLRRVFDIDVEHCECGGKLKIIAAIEEPVLVVRILTHLGLPAPAPPRAPARRPELIETV